MKNIKYKRLIIFVIVVTFAIILYFGFFKNVITSIKKFNDLNELVILDSNIKVKSLVALNLKSKKYDTIHFNQSNIFNYWRYYCSPCLQEFPIFKSLSKRKDYNVFLLTDDTTHNTFDIINKNFDLNFYYYEDTSIFGKTRFFPRTIVTKDSLIRDDITGMLRLNLKELNNYLDSINSIY